MTTNRFEASLFLPRPRPEVFAFFADAANLERITPPWLHFRIVSPRPIVMAAGTLIDYRLRVHRVPMRWRTRIGVWEPPHRFVDEQFRGPYRLWVHEHLFEEREGGTLCLDRVDYAVPGGRLVDRLLVRPDLRRIFSYRAATLAAIFGGEAPSAGG